MIIALVRDLGVTIDERYSNLANRGHGTRSYYLAFSLE